MNDATLKQLLRRADAGAAQPPPVDFAATLLSRRDARRRRRRFAGAAALLATIAAGSIFHAQRHAAPAPPPVALVTPPHVPTPAAPDGDPDPAAWLALADRMQAAERLARARRTLDYAHSAVAAERERTAALLVAQGDWRRRSGSDGGPDYRRAAELFADTRAATVARARLEQG